MLRTSDGIRGYVSPCAPFNFAVVAGGIAGELAGSEHVPEGAEDGVLDGAERAAVTAAWAQALALGGDVGVLGAGGGHRGHGQGGVEPLGAVAALAGAAFAGGAVIAGTLAGPAHEAEDAAQQ